MVFNRRWIIRGVNAESLFLAKDVAEWIEHTHTTHMLKSVDEDEKLNVTILHAGQNREVTMLTEDGLYEVLVQSLYSLLKTLQNGLNIVIEQRC